MGALFLCGENNSTLSEWLLPRAVSADSPIIFRWNVQCSEPLFSLARRTTAEGESEHFRDETKPDYSAVLPLRPGTILCAKVSLVRHIFKPCYASNPCLCGRICACGEKSCTLQDGGCRGRVLLARESVSLAFWKVTGGLNRLDHFCSMGATVLVGSLPKPLSSALYLSAAFVSERGIWAHRVERCGSECLYFPVVLPL